MKKPVKKKPVKKKPVKKKPVKKKPLSSDKQLVEREIKYNEGFKGWKKWCEDYVRIPIYVNGLPLWVRIPDLPEEENKETGRSSKYMWKETCKVCEEALETLPDGRFKYRLIVFCWMRGEGKSLAVCLIQLWKFFNFPRQQIMLGANSKDQVKFVHFDLIRDIILNSEKLLKIVGRRNVLDKQIQLRDEKKNVVSIIRSISSFSGIVSNITGYTFSEIFDMKNPKFFTQLDGSIRNMPNALGLIDSTVSSKEHVLYKLYNSFINKKAKALYFSYRSSPKASYKDFWHPEMTAEQLNDYEAKFPPDEFAMYFKNTWESGTKKMWSREEVYACRYAGALNSLGEQKKVVDILKQYFERVDVQAKEKSVIDIYKERRGQGPENILKQLNPIDNLYTLRLSSNHPKMCSLDELRYLSDLYDTNFAVLTGADRADPMKVHLDRGARTICTAIAKGLPGSRSNPYLYINETSSSSKNYIYFLLHLEHVQFSDMPTIQKFLETVKDIYGSVESFCTERWGMWDIQDWCDDEGILLETLSASYDKQKAGFSELYNVIKTGRFKTPILAVGGNKEDDIFIEEACMFDHSEKNKFYGSPEKRHRYGVQDDAIFALNWTIYGGRFLSVSDFVDRETAQNFGEFIPNKNLLGNYKEKKYGT